MLFGTGDKVIYAPRQNSDFLVESDFNGQGEAETRKQTRNFIGNFYYEIYGFVKVFSRDWFTNYL